MDGLRISPHLIGCAKSHGTKLADIERMLLTSIPYWMERTMRGLTFSSVDGHFKIEPRSECVWIGSNTPDRRMEDTG
ncbi:hypothetical protein I7I53_09792 [Histoplasma capsulatum var. duboisii H88]|uniref:Uncharacterized protein n=1 Tax=Ajellomyces capsulatus (strain H88) TaxID=544711 RepID=A0A8A1L670_AJEC8|nr:hypothetical protein I7I53_09792 [Histoplasma capsulatum var. duboisii H88]